MNSEKKLKTKREKEEWEKRQEERKNAPEVICPRCSHKNAPDSLFCARCGAPISQGFGSNQNGENNAPFGRVIINPFFVPQDPNEEIDGIPAWKLSAVVGKNSHRVIPQFKFFAKTDRKVSFNIFACLLTPFYFLYRKMYALGIITLILEFILSIPSLVLNFSNEYLSETFGQTVNYGLNLDMAQTTFFSNLSFYASIASFAISVLCALFANWLYFDKCKKLCAKIDKIATSQEDFKERAAKKGGVSFKPIIIIAIVYSAICFFGMYILAMFMTNPELFRF